MKTYQVVTKLITTKVSVNDEGKIIKEKTDPVLKWTIGKDFAWLIKYLEKEGTLIRYTNVVSRESVIAKDVDRPELIPSSPVKDKKAIICPECDGTGTSIVNLTEGGISTNCSECKGTGIVSKAIVPQTLTDIKPEEQAEDDNNDDSLLRG